MVSGQHVNAAGSRVFMLTLTDRAVVHESIAAFAVEHDILTASFDMLGGLHSATLTAYDFVNKKRHPAVDYQGALELISCHGTLAQLDGQPHVHIHCAFMAPATGGDAARLVGGHLAHATAFAIEITLTAHDGNPMQRRLHPTTGLQLWDPHE